MKIFVDLHVLQSIPPSCLNRDDTGTPKTAVYGGARRARVSSQSWKRAMRLMFNEYFDASELSVRTKHVFDMVADEIIKMAPDYSREEAIKKAREVLSMVKNNGKEIFKKDDDDKLEVLFFMSLQQAKNIASVVLNEADEKAVINDIKKILDKKNRYNGVDLALFGRMVAADPSLNCDAAAQVAHAISTHRVENDYDYFTAVDDLASETQEHAGGGHLGTIEFNSATLYRYATVAVHKLYKELAYDSAVLEKAIREFTRAFICAIPTGRQNTFAAHTIPDAVLVAIRTDRPLNLVGAFENPISGEGFAKSSAEALMKYAEAAYADFCVQPTKSYIVGQYLAGLGERLSLDEMLTSLSRDINDRIGS